MSEDQQLKDTTPEAGDMVTAPDAMDIDVALVLYKNLTPALIDTFKLLVSPHHHDKKGKATKVKNQATKMTDLMLVAQVLEKVVLDLDIKPNQFESEKANNLYGNLMAVFRAKEVIKNDIKSKIANNEVANVSEELKQKVLKEL